MATRRRKTSRRSHAPAERLLPLLPRSSSVLYIGSTLAEKAVPGAFSYVVSKHAQLGMMRATCQDLLGRGIHTAMICPGFTATDMLRTHLGNDPEVEAAIASMNSFNRLIEPREIAELIHWAHHHPVINGAVVHANLGQHPRMRLASEDILPIQPLIEADRLGKKFNARVGLAAETAAPGFLAHEMLIPADFKIEFAHSRSAPVSGGTGCPS